MRRVLISIIVAIGIAGCTIHPPGEKQERAAAIKAGKPFEKPATQRIAPPLPAPAGPDDLVRYALLTSPEVEQRYWEWRSAIEQIPQAGTQQTNLAISAGTIINSGNISRENSTLSLGSDPMANIVLPQKLSVAAQRALDDARAAGKRFQKAKFDLRQKVLDACYDYARTTQLIEQEKNNANLLRAMLAVISAQFETGASRQQDALKTQNELDLSLNDIARMNSELRSQLASVNAMLNRPVDAPMSLSVSLSAHELPKLSDAQILEIAARNNPELASLSDELRSRGESIELARLQRLPDFSINVGTDLAGMAQNLMGMISLPILRYQAIDAAIAQAHANLRATQAMIQQTRNDVRARTITDLIVLRDSQRQLQLFNQKLLPRAQQIVTLTRTSYESGQSSLIDVLDSQRMLISLNRLVTDLQSTLAKRMVDLESIAALKL